MQQLRSNVGALALALAVLTGCEAPVGANTSVTITPETIAELRATPTVAAELGKVAATLAFNGTGTDLQRETLTRELVGQVVEWEIAVYEVAREGEAYRITSQAVALEDPNAVDLVHVLSFVHSTSDAETAAIHAVKSGDRLRIRGRVRDVFLRTSIVLDPAVLVAIGESKSGSVTL